MIEPNLPKETEDAKVNVRKLRRFVGEGGTLLDLGTNVGEVAIRMAPHFDLILGVEAHPETFSRALERIIEAKVDNVRMMRAAVHYLTGIDMFVSSPLNSTGASAREVMRRRDPDYYRTTRSVSLADLTEQYRPRVIKMDIEGSEYQCILQGREWINDALEFLVVEYHGSRTPKGWDLIQRCEDRLADRGLERIDPPAIRMGEDGLPKARYFVSVYWRKR